MRNQKPRTTTTRQGTRVQHSELFWSARNISKTFTSTAFEINPGNPALFPWLSRLAVNFEDYRFSKLKFHFRTRTSRFISGTVAMAPDYDSSDSAPTGLAEAMSYRDAANSVVYNNFSISLSPAMMFSTNPHKLTRVFPSIPTAINTFDAGNLYIMHVIDSDPLDFGDFWIEYDILLRSPQIPRPIEAQPGSVSSFRIPDSATAMNLTVGSGYEYFMNELNFTSIINQIPGVKVGIKGGYSVIELPAGTYALDGIANVTYDKEGGTPVFNEDDVGTCFMIDHFLDGKWANITRADDTGTGNIGPTAGTAARMFGNPTISAIIKTAAPYAIRGLLGIYANNVDGTELPNIRAIQSVSELIRIVALA